MASYKEQHELFISGHNGTTLTEVAAIILAPSANILMRDLLLFQGLHSLHSWFKIGVDFTVIVIPMILTCTVMSHLTIAIFITCHSVALALFCVQFLKLARSNFAVKIPEIMNVEMTVQRPAITNMRSLFNVSTAVVILAVDFAVFPRRLAKTETFGTGFMDVGVGCFVVSNAIVCAEARGKLGPCRSVQDGIKRVFHSLHSSLPLLLLGVGRLVSIKGIDYHEHVTEYGVHWNFFFTLAVVKIVCSIVLCIIPVTLTSAVAVGIISIYQYILNHQGLSHYIMSDAAREGMMDANKEGIFSSIGYISLYFVGAQMGMIIFRKK